MRPLTLSTPRIEQIAERLATLYKVPSRTRSSNGTQSEVAKLWMLLNEHCSTYDDYAYVLATVSIPTYNKDRINFLTRGIELASTYEECNFLIVAIPSFGANSGLSMRKIILKKICDFAQTKQELVYSLGLLGLL